MYSSQVLDHFEHPRNSGILDRPDESVQLENPVCGDVLRLTVKMVDGRIAKIKFLAKGCVPVIACGSALTELVSGKTLEQASSTSREDLERHLGSLPEASTHASHLALDALGALIKRLQSATRLD